MSEPLKHDMNNKDHRVFCRRCRQAFRNSGKPTPPLPFKGAHPHGDDPAPPAFEICPNRLCKNRQYPVGRLDEHRSRYPQCDPAPMPSGWTKQVFGHDGYFVLLHDECAYVSGAVRPEQIPDKITAHVAKKHA